VGASTQSKLPGTHPFRPKALSMRGTLCAAVGATGGDRLGGRPAPHERRPRPARGPRPRRAQHHHAESNAWQADCVVCGEYAISPCMGAAGLTIGFSWNALPPAGPAPGSYQVFGYVALPTGAPTPNTEVSATYTVDVATPTPTPTPTSHASAAATPASTASASPAGLVDVGVASCWDRPRPGAGSGGGAALLAGWIIRRRRPRAAPGLGNDRAA